MMSMRTVAIGVASTLVVGCGFGDSKTTGAWVPGDESGDAGETGIGDGIDDDGLDDGVDDGMDDGPGTTTGIPDPDAGDDESTGGADYDCTPAWDPQWIGSPCMDDTDCSYDGGYCLREDEGFPCGTCSLACDNLCPDQDGAPETFCIDGADVDIESAGYCLSKCDPGLLGDGGCRDGYNCAPLERYMEPGTVQGVCVPNEVDVDPMSSCQAQLLDAGAVFVPVDHIPDNPDGFPNLTCDIEDPVLIYPPIGAVDLRYYYDDVGAPVKMSCDAALSLVGSAAVAEQVGAVEIIHVGTYVCKVIGNGPNISQHGLGNAIDISGLTLDDGTEIYILDDWEDFVENPVTMYGQILRSFADQIWMLGLWTVILTPESNADHDNHLHIDITPGGNTYPWG